ncbi:MAG: ABC transporter permease subunit [Candidatus Korarchaeota archaeon]|nr:ABC transporter permease subunit [Thermoproteota archaeon]
MAIIIGLLIGLLMYYNKIGRFFFEPLIIFGMSFPVITLIPAFVLWFGYGHVSRILLVTLACTFPIALSTYNGASNVKKEFIWTAMCLGTRSKLKLLRKVILPASLPFILSGTRISLHISLIVAFVFEMVAGGGGLGFLEIRAARFFLAPELFATLFTILMVGFVLDRTMQYLQKTILIWI